MNLLEAARAHHSEGRSVIAVTQEKRPYHQGWNAFFTRRQTVEELENEFSNAAHGLALILHPSCSFCVLDFDGPHADDAWASTCINLPESARINTRSSGKHLYYRMPADAPRFKRAVRIVKANCDCKKSCGVDLLVHGYALVPPSPGYCEDPDHPIESAVEIPIAVIALAVKNNSELVKRTGDPNTGRVSHGERKSVLTSLAGSMRARGMSIDAIRAALHADNEARFDPPLDERDIEDVLKSATKWERQGNNEPKKPRTPITTKISDVKRENVTWIWKNRIPKGKLTIIEGDPGVGKSFLTQAIGAAVSRGTGLPGENTTDPGTVILMSAEDGLADTIRPRLEDMGADLTRVIALSGLKDEEGKERCLTLADLDVIETAIVEHRPSLVVIDPIIAYIAGKDANKAHEVRSLLAPLAALAEKHQTAIVTMRHLNKSAAKASYRGQGSIDFLAACRSAFLVGEDPQDSSRKVICHTKSNLGPKTASLTYTIDKGRFDWGEETSLTADQILAVPTDTGENSKLAEAKKVLEEILAKGPTLSTEAEKEAKKAGIASSTLKRARQAMGVVVSKAGFGGGWIWKLPARRSSSPEFGLLRENTSENRGINPFKSTNRTVAPKKTMENGDSVSVEDDLLRQPDPLGMSAK